MHLLCGTFLHVIVKQCISEELAGKGLSCKSICADQPCRSRCPPALPRLPRDVHPPALSEGSPVLNVEWQTGSFSTRCVAVLPAGGGIERSLPCFPLVAPESAASVPGTSACPFTQTHLTVMPISLSLAHAPHDRVAEGPCVRACTR